MIAALRILALLVAALCPTLTLAQGAGAVVKPEHTKSALLVVDAQVGVLSSIWEPHRVVRNLERLVANARSAGAPVIWIQHSDNGELKFGSEAWKLAPSFSPDSAEIVVQKKYNSAFAATDLDQKLRALGVSRIVLAGALTNWCIRSTAYAAVDRGYDLALVSDAHSTEALKLPSGNAVSAESIVTELNTVFQWVSVPNVRTEVKKTDDIAF
jgi:nicotinamidase-related amidase